MSGSKNFDFFLEIFFVITQRTRVPNFKFIAQVSAELTFLGVVTGGATGHCVILFSITTIFLLLFRVHVPILTATHIIVSFKG